MSLSNRTTELQELTSGSNGAQNKEQSNGKPNILSDAISNARNESKTRLQEMMNYKKYIINIINYIDVSFD